MTAQTATVNGGAPQGAPSASSDAGSLSAYLATHLAWQADCRDMLETLLRVAAVTPGAEVYITSGLRAAASAIVRLQDRPA